MDPISIEPQGPYTELNSLLLCRLAARNLALPERLPVRNAAAGRSRTRLRGRGMEFSEIRQYQPGDDVRSIDWRVTARAQKPYTKLYSEERQRSVFLLVDQRAGMFFGSQQCFKSVYAAQLAALLGWMAAQNGDRVGAMIAHHQGTEDIRPRGSQHAMLALINRLHARNHQLQSPAPAPAETGILQLLADCVQALKPGATLLLISDCADWSPECQKYLALLARHCDIMLIHLFDPLEQQLPAQANLAIASGNQQVALTASQVRSAAQAFERARARLQSDCESLGLGYYPLRVDTPLLPWAQRHFGRNRKARIGGRRG